MTPAGPRRRVYITLRLPSDRTNAVGTPMAHTAARKAPTIAPRSLGNWFVPGQSAAIASAVLVPRPDVKRGGGQRKMCFACTRIPSVYCAKHASTSARSAGWARRPIARSH